MSKYKPLYSSIWTDNQFENYSPEKKLIFIFLVTNQYVEKSGIYKLSLRQIVFNTGLINDIINKVINELIDENKIQYDFKEGIIFIRNIFKYQKGMIKNENILLLTLKRNYELVRTDFWGDFFELYYDDKLIIKIKQVLIDESILPHQLYININNNKNKDINKDEPEKKPKEDDPEIQSQFESFWQSYKAIHTGKGVKDQAKESFKKALKISSFEEIERGLKSYMDDCHAKNIYTKQVSVWLNKQGWKGEYSSSQEQVQKPNQYANPSYLDYLTGGK